jgi:hypothetical protein
MIIGVYNIWFILFCIVFISLVFIGILKNILTSFGVGLLVGIFILVIIGYDLLIDLRAQELIQKFNLTVSNMEKQILKQKLIKYFGICP